jgi:uncharacterized membrane protein (UPF0127 family)
MRVPTHLLFLVVLCSACHRSEEPESSPGVRSASLPAPPPSAPAASTPPAASAAATATSPTTPAIEPTELPKAPCITPLAKTPPPEAKPAQHCPKDTGTAPKLERRTLRFVDSAGAPKLKVEMARAPSEHERGLMFRTKLGELEGMLFEWPSEAPRVFWMRNTCIPLDMLFINKDGVVVGIQENVPTLNEAPRTVPCPAAYVLEVNAGWCRRHEIEPGMHMKVE